MSNPLVDRPEWLELRSQLERDRQVIINMTTTVLTTVSSTTSSVSSSPSPTQSPPERDENLAIIEIATLGLIFVLIMFGNLCVLVALGVKNCKMTRMYYFLLHLCLSDLITGLCTVLPQLLWDITYRFQGNNISCKLVKCMQIFGPYLSSYVLVMTAIDRYQAICHPLSNCRWTPRRSKLMISGAWLVSVLCALPQAVIFSYQQVPGTDGVFDCWGTFPQPWGERIYVTWYAVSVFFIPLVVITYCYVFICREVWINVRDKRLMNGCATELNDIHQGKGKSGKDQRANLMVTTQVGSSSSSASNNHRPSAKAIINPRSHSQINRLSRAKIKTVKVTVVVVICYIVCSCPFICVQLWAYWYPGAQQSAVWTGPLIAILMLLSSLNSCVNPWVYLVFNPNLLKSLATACRCKLPCRSGADDDDLDRHRFGQSLVRHTSTKCGGVGPGVGRGSGHNSNCDTVARFDSEVAG